MAVKRGYECDVCDIAGAFLYGPLPDSKIIHVRGWPGLNLGYGPNGRPYVLLLTRSVHGIKEAPQVWYVTLVKFLESLGYRPLDTDPCVFRHDASDYRRIILHVDDMKLVFESRESLDLFKAALSKEYNTQPIADLGPIKECVGIEYTKVADGMELRLTKYISKMAKKFGLEVGDA